MEARHMFSQGKAFRVVVGRVEHGGSPTLRLSMQGAKELGGSVPEAVVTLVLSYGQAATVKDELGYWLDREGG